MCGRYFSTDHCRIAREPWSGEPTARCADLRLRAGKKRTPRMINAWMIMNWISRSAMMRYLFIAALFASACPATAQNGLGDGQDAGAKAGALGLVVFVCL